MFVGIVAGIVTGALWGLTFVAARAVQPYSPWDITVLRYGLFGIVSLVLMVWHRFRPVGMGARELGTGFLLGAVCYPAYFLTIAFAVLRAGPAIPPLVVGLMPVVLATVGNLREKTVSWRALSLPLALIAVGVLIVNAAALGAGVGGRPLDVLAGTLWAFGALVAWVVFGAINAAVMRKPSHPTALRWTCVQGFGALCGSALLLPLTSWASRGGLSALVQTPEGWRLLAWSVVMGVGGSWFAAWAWIVSAERLPLAFAAQLVVFETIFGLLDGFIADGRWPSSSEWIGSCLQIAGVVVSIAIFSRPGEADATGGGRTRVVH